MSRTDYWLAVQVIREHRVKFPHIPETILIDAFVKFFQRDGSPLFDVARFKSACWED